MTRVALVTGAGTGIGRAVALALAGAGYEVVLAGRRSAPLEAVAHEGGARCRAVPTDVTREREVAALFDQVTSWHGRLDLLFNNAGVGTGAAPLPELALADWQRVIDTNLTGTFLCTRAAFALMQRQDPRGGRIINNGSLSASVPRPHMAAYTASKHAVTGLTRATALEGRPLGIACGQIDIGNADTALAQDFERGTLQADLTLKAEPTMALRHVAEAVLYMAGLPLEANVLFMTVMATGMPFVGRG